MDESRVRSANHPSVWDELWSAENAGWREGALTDVYKRIAQLIPKKSTVLDLGGGVGGLAQVLKEDSECTVTVWDHSSIAIQVARERGFSAECIDLEEDLPPIPEGTTCIVSTETLEHLTRKTVDKLLTLGKTVGQAFFSVPNGVLWNYEEQQHNVNFTAISLKKKLEEFFERPRVECIKQTEGDNFVYLLGVCGFPKPFRLSFTLPVRDEAEDLPRVLASFRGVADEIIVGVDPRTEDKTREVAAPYADIVFDLEDPTGPPGGEVPEKGVHFAWVRNQCIKKCTGDWIFMCEGHEHLGSGVDELLHLHTLPEHTRLVFVSRSADHQQWAFPWLFKKADDIYFERSTHNVLEYPKGTYAVSLPSVVTIHARKHEKDVTRQKQRRVQNRKMLFEDWLARGSEHSLYYFGAEWREHDEDRAVLWMERFLATARRSGSMRYQCRLQLAKLYMQRMFDEEPARRKLGRPKRTDQEKEEALTLCRKTLLGCFDDDWSRIEHCVWLGDLSVEQEKYEEALQWFGYAATRIGKPPFTFWWVDLYYYGHITAQRMAMTNAVLGNLKEASEWAQRVIELIPDDLEPEDKKSVIEECERNLKEINEALEKKEKNPTEGVTVVLT